MAEMKVSLVLDASSLKGSNIFNANNSKKSKEKGDEEKTFSSAIVKGLKAAGIIALISNLKPITDLLGLFVGYIGIGLLTLFKKIYDGFNNGGFFGGLAETFNIGFGSLPEKIITLFSGITGINWEDFISFLSWTDFVNPLAWWNYITDNKWSDWLSKNSWTSWLTKNQWSSWLTGLGWGLFINPLSWSIFIPALTISQILDYLFGGKKLPSAASGGYSSVQSSSSPIDVFGAQYDYLNSLTSPKSSVYSSQSNQSTITKTVNMYGVTPKEMISEVKREFGSGTVGVNRY